MNEYYKVVLLPLIGITHIKQCIMDSNLYIYIHIYDGDDDHSGHLNINTHIHIYIYKYNLICHINVVCIH